ncbi:MAG: HAD-IC family P-type ATPase [Candidatus Gottesmanbacteria bacterium]|nr:HAD-IC family P-type ATPase [Candidatus Gottesmanbacteria bacterium]
MENKEEITQNLHLLKTNEIFQLLKTDSQGLASKEAEKRLNEFGPNKLAEEKKTSPQNAVEALKKMTAPEANVLRDGELQKILSQNIVPGDVLVLSVGDKVSADARIVEEMGLEINEAVLTGESLSVKKDNVVLKEKGLTLGDRKNMVYSGTIITHGHAKAVVVATGQDTEFGKIAQMISSVETEKTPLELRLEKIGRQLGIGSLVVCAIASFLGILRGYPALEMFLWGVSLAVAAVPEALPAVVTGSLSIGVWEMAKRKAIVRKLPAVETLGSVSVICSDKTGTLTKNEMTVKEVFVNGKTVFVEGAGYDPEGGFLLEKGDFNPTKDKEFLMLSQIGLLCNDAVLEQKGKEWVINGDPTEGALVVLAAKAGLNQEKSQKDLPRVGEAAFEMERKRMSTIHPLGDKDTYLVAVKGAPESILERCSKIQENGVMKELKNRSVEEILKKTEAMAGKALRVLAFAYKEIRKGDLPQNLENLDANMIEKDLIFVGLVGMIDPPREETAEAVKACFSAGIKPIIVTGDHVQTTLSIGRQIGLFKEGDSEQILEGSKLDSLSDEELIKIVEKRSYARVSPHHKLRIVSLLKQKGFVVAMTGDGINDAPALKKADIGISMGIAGTDVTKEASDMILADDNFATIVVAIQKGREIFDNIKKYLFYLLRCNIGEILVLGGGFFVGLPPLLSTVQILWINLATDGLPAMALGIDPPSQDILERKPVPKKESIFSRKSVILILVLAVNMVVVLIPQFHYLLSKVDLIKAQTIIFATMVMMEMVNSFNSRSDRSIFASNPFSNKWLNLAVISSVSTTFLIIQVPLLSSLFKTTALETNEWFMVTVFGFSALFFSETTKFIMDKLKFT